jgi:4-aminobutyrate aminotransferase-like enzyme
MIRWFKQVWCSYRGHPYSTIIIPVVGQRPQDPEADTAYCSNCGVEANDQIVKILRYYASQPYADSCNETVHVKALLLTSAAQEIERLHSLEERTPNGN